MEHLTKLIQNADIDTLADILMQWAASHNDFKLFAIKKLDPDINEIDFSMTLQRCINNSERLSYHNGIERVAVDWGNVYHTLIKPWSEAVDSITTPNLFELVLAIVYLVGGSITDNDFEGDDWYGDDYSGSIADIIESICNLAGHLFLREDLSSYMLTQLEKAVREAEQTDVIDLHIGNGAYSLILRLVEARRKAGRVTSELYDILIESSLHNSQVWMLKKIEYLRNQRQYDAIEDFINKNLHYPKICMVKYEQLVAKGLWDDAIALLDYAHSNIKNDRYFLFSDLPNWLKLKQNILDSHYPLESRIENLSKLFNESYDTEKVEYYNQLKSIIPASDWNAFYHKLLSEKKSIGSIAPFLIAENEHQWLLELIKDSMAKYPNNYELPLKYASFLAPIYGNEFKEMLIKAFHEYASSQFAPKQQVKNYEYTHFCENLNKLIALGYKDEMIKLVEYFIATYKQRRNLLHNLKKLISD